MNGSSVEMDVAAPATRRKRPRFSLRTMILGMVAAGVVFGLVGRATHRYQVRRRIGRELRAQHDATEAVLAAVRTAAWRKEHLNSLLWRSGSGNARCSPSAWTWRSTRVYKTAQGQYVEGLNIRVEGARVGDQVDVIRIHDQGGDRNSIVIQQLTEAYAKNEWRFQIFPSKANAN